MFLIIARYADPLSFLLGCYESELYLGSDSWPEHPITVNGESYKVRENLYHALRQFRETRRCSSGMTLWVDAISLNQDGDTEKAAQVMSMKDIYSAAISTIVWLGKSLGPQISHRISDKDYIRRLDSLLGRIPDITAESFTFKRCSGREPNHFTATLQMESQA